MFQMRKIGINIDSYRGMDDDQYVKRIAELGFSAIHSFAYDKSRLEKIANACAVNGIEYENLHAPFKNINNIWYDDDSGDIILDELLECVNSCTMVGAGMAVIHLSSGENPPPVTDIGRKRFTKLIDYAKQKNIKLAFENQRKLSNLAWVLENFTPDDNVGFCWDCGHENCFTKGREYMPLFGKRLFCTHIHDNFGVYNQDSHLLPFDGNMDFNKFADHIKASGFEGNLMLEVMTKASDLYNELSIDEYLIKAAESAKKLRNYFE
jgi:sugar phosphate isomerase/epimerase